MSFEHEGDYFEDVGAYYDPQEQEGNINFELAKKDLIFHHHSGICNPNSVFSEMTEEELLHLLHQQEHDLTLRGMQYLGAVSSKNTGLDAGCGRGGSSIMFHQIHQCKMVGLTLSRQQAIYATQASKKIGMDNSILFLHANMLETPFQNNAFDFIWACESTEHIPNLDDMYAEFSRVTSSEAHLVIIAACGVPTHPEGQKYIESANKWYHMRVHSRQEYLESATKNGWNINADIDLTPETIPYWDLRARSQYKTGVEKLNNGYKIGAGEYRLYSFTKKA